MANYNWAGTPAITMAKASAWPKLAGARPSEALLDQAASLLKRTGTAKHLALAMYMRPSGATQTECIAATGDTAMNAYSEAWRHMGCKAVPVLGRNGHKAYCLALPSKAASKAAKAASKAAKPDQAAKPAKAASKAAKPASKAAKPASKAKAAKAAKAASNAADQAAKPDNGNAADQA